VNRAFGILYHIWYYALMLLSILALFPWLFWYSRRVEQFPQFYRYGRIWAAWILNGMGLIRKVRYESRIDWSRAYMVVSNHSSELDIMYCYRLIKSPTVFIGKAELAKLQLFGFFFKRSCIVVDRSSLASKRQVLEKARRRLARGSSMCIYPEGGIPKDPKVRLGPFKNGAFQLAVEAGVPILPITFADNRRHFPDFSKGGFPGRIRATVHSPIETAGADADALNAQVYALILAELNRYASQS